MEMNIRRPRRLRVLARAACGFTLVEVLIVVAIAAVLASIAIPSFRVMMINMEIRGTAFELVTQMALARSEALKRNAVVQIDAVGGNWNNGWQILFGATVLRETPAVKRVNVALIPAATTSIKFSQTGRVTNGSLNIEVSDPSATSAELSCVTVGLTGIASSKKGAC